MVGRNWNYFKDETWEKRRTSKVLAHAALSLLYHLGLVLLAYVLGIITATLSEMGRPVHYRWYNSLGWDYVLSKKDIVS